jgi:DNA modification methylase
MSSYLLAGDCREKLSYIDSETVDLTIMSPPYKDRDGYSDSLMFEVSQQLYRVHRPGTLAFINFGHMADYKSRPFDVVRMFEGTGWELKETFIWVKNHFKPIQGHRRVNNIFEYIFMFNKTPMPLLGS